MDDVDIDYIFKRYYPNVLKYTFMKMNNGRIKFLDILIIKINNIFQYIMQIKPMKLEFFVPYSSNHPKHMKINIVKNMTYRAIILCSNKILYGHTILALKMRFRKSGYPESFLNEHMNKISYEERDVIINKLNINREDKNKEWCNNTKLYHKSLWIPQDEKKIISIPYDESLKHNDVDKQMINTLKYNYPHKRIIYKLNNSIQKVIRCKDANYDL